MNLANTLKFRDMKAAVAGTQATTPDPRSADEWIKKFLDEKNKRLNNLRQSLHKLLDHPPALDEYMRPELKAAYNEYKDTYNQSPKKMAGGGKWAVTDPEGLIISVWKTRKEAENAAFAMWRGIAPSSTGATAGARIKKLDAADIFLDTEHGDRTRAKFLKHPKPKVVRLADAMRHGDLRPSSHGGGAAGVGGTGGPSGGGGGGV